MKIKKIKKVIFDKRKRERYIRLLLKKETPERLSKAISVGIFLSFLIPQGIHTIFVLIFSFLLKLNFIFTLVGNLFVNYITMIPIYWFCFEVGKFITGTNVDWLIILNSLKSFDVFKVGVNVLFVFYIGLFIVGSTISIIFYFIMLYILKKGKI